MILLYALIGLLVGGVLNSLADTLPSKTSLRLPYCAHCDTARPPNRWLATISYIVRNSQCVNCGAPLPRRNLPVELGTAVVFGFLYQRHGLTGHMILLSVYLAILILITVIDLEHRLVLNRVIGPAILLALIAGPFTPDLNWKQMLVGGLVAFGLFYLAAMLYPGGMGAGDVKLAAFIGLITGFPVVFVALLVTVFAGGLISLLLVVTRLRSRRDYIPYGPFLVIGGVYALFWGQPIMDDYLDLERQTRTGEVTKVSVKNDYGARADAQGRGVGLAQLPEYGTIFITAAAPAKTVTALCHARYDVNRSVHQNVSVSSQPSSSQSSSWLTISLIRYHSSRAASATSAISGSGSAVSSSSRSNASSQPV